MNIKSFFSAFRKSTWSETFSVFGETTEKANKDLYFGIIFSCIDAIANAVADVEWGLFTKKGTDWQEIESHPLLTLIKNPNQLQTFTDFMYLVSTHIDTNGSAFILPTKTALVSKNIVELRLLNPNKVVTEPDANDYPAKYKYSSRGKIFEYKADEMINVIRSDPFKQYLGMSTIAMARYEGNTEVNALEYNNSFYQNGAVPGGVIRTDQAINADNFKDMKARIKQQYQGKKNAFKLMFLTHGFDYKQVISSQKDMEYVAQRKLTRDQILSIFKVPKSIVAVSDQLNKATAEVEYMAFMKNVVKPRIELIFDKLNKFLLPAMGLDPELYQLQYTNPVPEDKDYKLQFYNSAVNTWMTVNEVRQEEGLEPIDGGDELLTAKLLTNLTKPDKEEEPPEEEEKPPKEEKKSDKCHSCKEGQPNPKDAGRKANQEYVRRKNRYFANKEAQLSLKLLQHFNFLIKDIKKVSTKSNVQSDNPDLTPDEQFELTPEVVEGKLLPNDKKLLQWKILLFLIIYETSQQVYLVALKQLKEAVGYQVDDTLADTLKSFISNRAKFSSKSIGDTLLQKIRDTIKSSVDSGVTDLGKIKNQVIEMLADQKQWKIDQIARTELSWAYGEAEHETYVKNGIKHVEWLCGSAPCPTCQQNCGKVVSINEMFPTGHQSEPVHPNCTCTVLGLPE